MKVLIVDDEPHLIHAIKALVPWQEYDIDKVLSATTAAEARELLSREQPQLAFFDIMIGDERGTDLMNYVVEQKISSKVIAISGYSDFEYVRSMLVLGCVDYLPETPGTDRPAGSSRKGCQYLEGGPQEKR